MKFILLLPAFLLMACASTPNSKWRNPTNSEEKTTQLTVPVSDISSVIVFPGYTECKKLPMKIRGSVFVHNCVHASPYSFKIKNASTGIDKVFNGIYEVKYPSLTSVKDLTVGSEKMAFHKEQEKLAQTYFNDVAGGCYGPNIDVSVTETAKGQLITFQHHAYFGKARCSIAKGAWAGHAMVANSWTAVKDGAKGVASSAVEHGKVVVGVADALQTAARETVAAGLEYLAYTITPGSN